MRQDLIMEGSEYSRILSMPLRMLLVKVLNMPENDSIWQSS